MGLPGFTHVSTAQMSVPQEIISSAQRKRSAKGAIARPSGAAMKPPARRRMTTTVTQAVRNAPKIDARSIPAFGGAIFESGPTSQSVVRRDISTSGWRDETAQ